MRCEELMLNDWVRLTKVVLYCKVAGITPSGHIVGRTAGGGGFEQKAENLSPVELTYDTILCTSFWQKRKGVYKKAVRGVATFVYEQESRRLTVTSLATGCVNTHYISFLHELQQLYRHYTGLELEINLNCNKRKEYSRQYYEKKKEAV